MKISSIRNQLKKSLNGNRRRPLIVIASFAVVGAIVLVISQAATPTTTLEPENSTPEGNASKILDGSASNGGYIKFGDLIINEDLTSKRFFADNASWNQPVSAFGAATDPKLTMYRDRFWNYAGLPAAPGVTNVQFKDYSVPIYDASEANTTARAFQAIWAQNQTSFSTTGNVIGETIPWNTNWKPGTGNDRILQIVNYTTGKVYGLWIVGEPASSCDDRNIFGIAAFDGPNTKAGFSVNNASHLCMGMLTSNTTLFTGTDGNTIVDRGMGINKLALITRANEVKSGVIRHALELTISSTMFGAPNCSPAKGVSAAGAGVDCGVYVAPATRVEWGSNEGDRITNRCGTPTEVNTTGRSKTTPEGMRFALNITDLEIEGWLNSRGYTGAKRNTAKIFAVALRDYGAIIAETGCYGIGLETDGLVNPTSAATWATLGITDIAGNNNPHGDLLQGLLTKDRLYVVNPPN